MLRNRLDKQIEVSLRQTVLESQEKGLLLYFPGPKSTACSIIAEMGWELILCRHIPLPTVFMSQRYATEWQCPLPNSTWGWPIDISP